MVVMKDSKNFVFVFLFFLLVSVLLIVLNLSLFSPVTSTLSQTSYNILSKIIFLGQGSEEKRLKEENLSLSSRIVSDQKLLLENKALHDQFLVSNPKSFELLPANVIGAPRFLPAVTLPEIYILDVGEKDGVRVGNAVVFKDNLIGRVSKVTDSVSEVTLVINPNFKFAAKTSAGVLGIVKGQGNGDITFDNVLLSDTIARGDLILTSGDLKIDFTGLPSGIVVGKIVSVEKAPSELFQRAKLESFLDFGKTQNVFVVVGIK